METTETVERGGVTMDKHSAKIVDAIRAEFDRIPHWNISDVSSLAINRNRSFNMKYVGEHGTSEKIDKRVFDALNNAGVEVQGFHHGAVDDENTVRVWIGVPNDYFL